MRGWNKSLAARGLSGKIKQDTRRLAPSPELLLFGIALQLCLSEIVFIHVQTVETRVETLTKSLCAIVFAVGDRLPSLP